MAVLQAIMTDHQMVEGTNSYQGFLAVGTDANLPDDIGLSRRQLCDTWEFIVGNPKLFLPIVEALGMKTQYGILSLRDCVFEPKK